MLASMYDASLDQFKPHTWGLRLDVWPVYSGNNTWTANQTFSFVNSFEKYWGEPMVQQNEKIYDALLFNANNRILIRGMSSISNGIQGAVPGVAARESNLNDVVVIGYGTQEKRI